MIYRWHCGKCGWDDVTSTDLVIVPSMFRVHLERNFDYCTKKGGFYVTVEDETLKESS